MFYNSCASAINTQLKWWINLSQNWHFMFCKGRCCSACPGWWGKKYLCNHVDISFQQTHIELGGFFLGVPHLLNRPEQCIAHLFLHRLTVGEQRCWTAFDFSNYFSLTKETLILGTMDNWECVASRWLMLAFKSDNSFPLFAQGNEWKDFRSNGWELTALWGYIIVIIMK